MLMNQGEYSPEAYDYYWTEPSPTNRPVAEAVIEPGLEEVSNEFGLEVKKLEWGELPEQTGRIPYVLAGPFTFNTDGSPYRDQFDIPELRDHVGHLAAVPDVRLNFATAYRTGGDWNNVNLVAVHMGDASALGLDVPKRDQQLGGNTIYPDTLVDGQITVSAADIADNVRCETFRIGFRHLEDKSESAIEALRYARAEAQPVISAVRKAIGAERLWHRSPTDGALFVRTKVGWLASQTRTDKSALTLHDFSLIHGFDPNNNSITSTGLKPPSSDAPEFLVALEDSGADIGVHFHSHGLTRISTDEVVREHRTPETIRYGRFSSGPAVRDAVEAGEGWTILREHGVFWTGATLFEFQSFVGSTLIKNAHDPSPKPEI